MPAGTATTTQRGKVFLPRREFRNAATLCGVIAIGWAIFIAEMVSGAFEDRDTIDLVTRVNDAADQIASDLQREVLEFDIIGQAVSAVVSRQPDLSLSEYQDFLRPLADDVPAIINIATSREYIIDRVYPLDGNRSVLGIDYTQLPEQLASIEEILESGSPAIYGPFELVQGGTGFIQRAPIYRAGVESGSGTRDWLGVLSIVIDRDVLLQQALLNVEPGAFGIALRRPAEEDGEAVLLAGSAAAFEGISVSRFIAVGNERWEMGVALLSGFPVNPTRNFWIWTLSILFATLMGGVALTFWTLSRAKRVVESQLRSAIDSIDDGFALYDDQDRLVFANDRYRSYYSKSSHAIVPGNTFETILRAGLEAGQYEDAVGREEEWLQERLNAHANPASPVEQKLSDGRWLKVAETKSEDGNTVGFRVDITELKRAREAAESANRAKSTFLNVVSHELRTPLTSVIGYARLIENMQILPTHAKLRDAVFSDASRAEKTAALNALAAEVGTMANRIILSGDHLLSLINDMLDRAKLQTDAIEITPGPVALDELVDEVLDEVRPSAQDKKIELIADLPPLAITGDKFRLRQALLNIVGNAVKFTDDGHIKVSAEADGRDLRLHVRDTGCGIDGDHKDRIFEEFVQVDASLTRRNSGTGLGLAITRKIVELHGGTISVDSTPGEGSTFTIVLPNAVTSATMAA